MSVVIRVLSILVGIELLAAGILCGWRLNSTRPVPPPVEISTDALTAADLLALPDRFLFDSPEKWRVLGETYLKQGYLHQAAACLARAAQDDPRAIEVSVMHGYCLDRLGRLDAAQEAFERAARQGRGPVKETACYFLGRICLQREQPQEAELAFLRAGDGHLPSVYQRARILLRTDRPSEAAPIVLRLIESLPEEVRVWQLQAKLAAALGRTDPEAAEAAEQARPLLWIHNLPPDLFKSSENIGMAREFHHAWLQQRAGDKVGAARRMLELTRDETRWQNSNPWLLETVAAASLDAGDLATARQLLDRQIVQEGFPTARAWNILGRIEFLEEHFEAAERCRSRAKFMSPAIRDNDKGTTQTERHEFGDPSSTFSGPSDGPPRAGDSPEKRQP